MTVAEKYPYLFNNYELDATGHAVDDPTKPGQLKVLSPRTPSLAELLGAMFNSRPAAMTGFALDIQEFLAMPKEAAQPATTTAPRTAVKVPPPPPPPKPKPTGGK